MSKRQRILVVLSQEVLDSQPEPALERGIFIARETNASLELFVSEYYPSFYTSLMAKSVEKKEPAEACRQATLKWLQEFSEKLAETDNLVVSADVGWNRHPYEGIMKKVSSIKPDLTIKTIRHNSSLNRTLFNYTDWRLIRSCPSPLLLAKSEDDWATRQIVACLDPAHIHAQAETLDDAIIEVAQSLTYRLRGELHIFHAIELLPEPMLMLLQPGVSYETYKQQTRQEHEALLSELLRPYGIRGPQRLHIREGKPADALQALVKEIHASLVVMGVVPKGTLENFLIGNTAEKVLDTLSCDILVVKSNPIEVKAAAAETAFC
jgi:universal stress protein E